MKSRLWAVVFIIIALAAIPACTQQFPAAGYDSTTSLGSFNVQIMPNFVGLFYNPNYPSTAQCPLFNSSTNILTSPPQLYDAGTMIGRSNPIPDGSNASPAYPQGAPSDLGGAPAPTSAVIVSENMLIPPPGFPCAGLSSCSSGPGTADVLTDIFSLHMTGSGAAVRAGIWYGSPTTPSTTPPKLSPGKVESQSGPNGAPNNNFPASSFFDVYAQIDIPACGGFPNAFSGATVYNLMPLVVKNNQVTSFPPQVVYLHDQSSIVPILFLATDTIVSPPRWHKDDILGYFLLVGHGVGYGPNSLSSFNSLMQGQSNATCPIGSPSGSSSLQLKSPPVAASPSQVPKATPGTGVTTPAAGSTRPASGGSGGNDK